MKGLKSMIQRILRIKECPVRAAQIEDAKADLEQEIRALDADVLRLMEIALPSLPRARYNGSTPFLVSSRGHKERAL